MRRSPLNEVIGGTPAENAEIICGIFKGEITDAKLDIVLFNAASGFVIQGANALTFSGPINLGVSPGVAIEVDNTAATIFSGNISDGGSNRSLTISSINAGVLTLRGSNSFTGGTIVSSGTLVGHVSNSVPSNVTVNGGTLQLDVSNVMSTTATLTVNSGTVNLNFTGYQTVSAPLPALVSITKSFAEPRYPSLKGIMGAKKKDIALLRLADLELAASVGGDGAKVELTELAAPPVRGKGRVVTAADAADGAKQIVDFLKERKLV